MPTFMNQHLVWLVLVSPLCLLLPYLVAVRRKQMASSMGTPEHRDTYSQPLSAVRDWTKAAALMVFVAAAGTALMRPVFTNQQVEFPADAADVVLLFDNSRSMYATDTDGGHTRMQAAKDTATEAILPVMGTNRVAVIAYAGEAKTVAYLDQARSAVTRAIKNSITPSSMPGDGSALGEAFQLAFRHFDIDSDNNGKDPKLATAEDKAKAGKRKKVIVLLSDGGTDEKTNYQEIVQGCQERKVQLLVFGFGGTSPAQIPVKELSDDDQRLADGPFYKVDRVPATTSIDERLLGWLAESLRKYESAYVHVTKAGDARFDRLVTGVEMQTRLAHRELYIYPLAVCLLAMLCAYLATAWPVRQKHNPAQAGNPSAPEGGQS